jgi:hypothetical protein
VDKILGTNPVPPNIAKASNQAGNGAIFVRQKSGLGKGFKNFGDKAMSVEGRIFVAIYILVPFSTAFLRKTSETVAKQGRNTHLGSAFFLLCIIVIRVLFTCILYGNLFLESPKRSRD